MESEINSNSDNKLVEMYINPHTTVNVNTLNEILKKIGYQLYYMNKIGNNFQILSDKYGEFLNCCYKFVLSCNNLKTKEPEFCDALEHIMSFITECHLFIIKFKNRITEEKIKKSTDLFMKILPEILNRFLHKDGYIQTIDNIQDYAIKEYGEEFQRIFNKRKSIINKFPKKKNEVSECFLLRLFEENKFDDFIKSIDQFLEFDKFEKSIHGFLYIEHKTDVKLNKLIKKHNKFAYKILTSIIKAVKKNINNICNTEYNLWLPRNREEGSEFLKTELRDSCSFFRILSIILNTKTPFEIEKVAHEITNSNSFDIFNVFKYNFPFMRSFIEMNTKENETEPREFLCEYIYQITQITNSILKIIIEISECTM